MRLQKSGLGIGKLGRTRTPRSWRLPTLVVFELLSIRKKLIRMKEARFLEVLPQKLIGDKAYNNDPLDQQMLELYGH